MTPQDLTRYRSALIEKLTLLKSLYRQSREGMVVERSADPLDQSIGEFGRKLAAANATHQNIEIRQVEAALRRIEQETYGVCISCDNPIPSKRLDLLPWASRCVRCQEVAETTPGGLDETRTGETHLDSLAD
jgi:DnaK suppressor protein